jgi:glycine oxidase
MVVKATQATHMSPDILIIGAGIIGSSLAWRLSQAGLRVMLIDSGKAGGEASWAGAGMLAPGGEIEEPSPWTAFTLESLALYPAVVEELTAESGISIDFQRLGAVEIARSEAEWQALTARAGLQAGLGIRSAVLSREELRERVPLLGDPAAGALFFPDDALVDPRDVTRALGAACRRRGVDLREGLKACSVRLSGREARVETAAGTLSAGAVVLAAGAWSGDIPLHVEDVAQPLPASFPVRGHLIGYHLQAGTLGPILRHGHTYLLQRASGFTIAGTSTERVGFDRTIDPEIVREIAGRASTLLPALAAAGPPEPWLGFRPGTPDSHPRIGRFAGARLWLAYGHYRNGILLAPATAQRLSREIISSSETDWKITGGSV